MAYSHNCRHHPSLQAGNRHQAQAMSRGLPSSSTSPQVGEKRKHRPPSLIHDGDDDVQIVGHHHPAGTSVPKPKAAASTSKRRDFGERSHASEGLSSHNHRQHQPARDYSQQRQGTYRPEVHPSSSTMHQHSSGHQSRHHHSSPTVNHSGPEVNTNKRHKHRGVHFQ